MKPYEFGAQLQRLSHIATMMTTTDVDGILEHLESTETALQLLGGDPARITQLKAFTGKALEFQRDCLTFQKDLSDADRMVGRSRRALTEGPATPDSQGG